MTVFQHQLWGYQIELPENWEHVQFDAKDGFALDPKAFQPGYSGDNLAQLLINAEWNSLRKPIWDIWQGHIAKSSLMLGAKNLGSAPWSMGGANGFEVEIVLPKKDPKRLWAGILEYGYLVLHFLVLHWKVNQEEMQPLITEIISSLEFLASVPGIQHSDSGLPLPQGLTSVDPVKLIDDIENPNNWDAFRGDFTPGALQAFFLRELEPAGWQVTRYVPYPSKGDLPFARIFTEKEDIQIVLGILPPSQNDPSTALVVKKLN
jgi:hypothetical protein